MPRSFSFGAHSSARLAANSADCPPWEWPAIRYRLPSVGDELAGGGDDVDDAAALGLADEVRMRAGSAEALIVGGDDRVARLDPVLELGWT